MRPTIDEPTDDPNEGKDRQFVTALARGLGVLDCFQPGEKYLGITEMARRTKLPKPTVSRLAGTLIKLGYLTFVPEVGKYSLGAGVLSLASTLLSNIDLRHVARPFMQEMADAVGASVSIGIRDRLSMVYVETIRTKAPIAIHQSVGSRLPLATTAMGRAYLAGCAPDTRATILADLRARDPAAWPSIEAGVSQALKDYERLGFCMATSEWMAEIAGVGVPFHDANGTLMAFNCGGLSHHLTPQRLEHEVGPALVDLARKVGAMIGCK